MSVKILPVGFGLSNPNCDRPGWFVLLKNVICRPVVSQNTFLIVKHYQNKHFSGLFGSFSMVTCQVNDQR